MNSPKPPLPLRILGGLAVVGVLSLTGYAAFRDTPVFKVRATHEIPQDCRRQNYQEVIDDAPEHRLRCAAHYYARTCSIGGDKSVVEQAQLRLWKLAVQTRDEEIVRLCRQYVPDGDCGTGDLVGRDFAEGGGR